MDLAHLILLAVVGSIALLVLSIGLSAPQGSVRAGIADRGAMGRAMLAMFVTLPLFTLVLIALIPLTPAARVALLAISVSPMPPILPIKQHKLGGGTEYALAIMVVASVVSLVAAPLLVLFSEQLFGRQPLFGLKSILNPILITIIVPLFIGIGVARFQPAIAPRLAELANKAGTVVLIVGLLPILWQALPGLIAAAGSTAMIAIILMTLFGLASGHLLGGPDAGNRRSLAIATASRHPGVALGLAAGAGLAERPDVVAVVLLHLLVSTLISAPYGRWAQQQDA